jgi:hypothetical protein
MKINNKVWLFFVLVAVSFTSYGDENTKNIWHITTQPTRFDALDIQRDSFGYFKNDNLRLKNLPPLQFSLEKTDRLTLEVLDTGIVTLDHPGWDLIIRSAMRFDIEALKQGQLLDVIQITLAEKGQNCLHYGRISLPSMAQIKEIDGSQRVLMKSGVFNETTQGTLQIDGGNCLYLKFTGSAPLTLSLQQSQEQTGSSNSYLAPKPLPVKPIETISEDYPAIDAASFRRADTFSYDDLTSYGAVINGTHYISRCQGRPNCDTLPLPSYSLAKSIVGGLGLMRLEKLYPGVKNTLVSDLIKQCHDWEAVTLAHLLDMTSGHYSSGRPHVDEGRYFWPFAVNPTAEKMTEFACRFSAKSTPGEKWVYRTSDTWLLGVAMQTIWQQKAGVQADFYDDLLLPIWQQLGLSALMDVSLRRDGAPYTGWGLVMTRDDIAKIAFAIAKRDPALVDQLDSTLFDTATQYGGGPIGSEAGDKSLRYSMGFWSWNAGPYLDCKSPTWVPTMSGFGGISVVMLPSGDVFYYFSDSGEYRYAEAIAALHKINPICKVNE